MSSTDQGPGAAGSGLTDAQLRATPVPVSGTVTTGGLTDTQLRASAVPVSAASLPLPTGAATETTLGSVVKDGTPITGQALEAGGASNQGWLSSIRKAITDRLPAALVGGRLDVNVGNTPAVTNANLDVALSTRTKPADQQHAIIDSATIAALTDRTQKAQITDGTRDGTVKAASTPAVATDTAVVVAVRDAVTANAGTNLNTSALALDATLTGRTAKAQITDGTRDGTVKAASTLPLLTDTAVVTTQRDPLPAGTNVLGHVVVDTAPAVTGTVTANQGTAAAASGAWPAKITDGTNVAAVKAASTAAAATDPAVVVAISPNNTVPENLTQVGGAAVSLAQKAAASSIPVVLPNDANGATQATATFHQNRALNTFTATYRLAARPYALSKAFTAGSRFQFATIHHPNTSTKTVKLKRVELALESSSAAAIVVADLMRITTAPATGNPAITPAAAAFADGVADSVCLALPTTAATEAALQSMQEWNLGITGTGSVINPPPGLNWYTLWPQTQGASEAQEDKFPTIRAGVLEGYAVTLDGNAITTVKGYIVIEFTEE